MHELNLTQYVLILNAIKKDEESMERKEESTEH
jgi:hypothetical protein